MKTKRFIKTHPQTAIEKLTLFLEEQILAKVDNEQIQDTTKSLEETKESLELIRQGEKDVLFFKFDPIVEKAINNKEDESMESNENESQNEIDSQDELQEEFNSLPSIPYKKQFNEDVAQQTTFNESDGSKTYIINDDDDAEDVMQDEMSEGQRTPVSSGSSSSSPHMEIIQQKLNDALKTLSSQEKMEHIRRQAKANAESQQKIKSKVISTPKQDPPSNQKNTSNNNNKNLYFKWDNYNIT